jgi:hypothetical protein
MVQSEIFEILYAFDITIAPHATFQDLRHTRAPFSSGLSTSFLLSHAGLRGPRFDRGPAR